MGELKIKIVNTPFRLTGDYTDLTNLDYNLFGLHKKRNIIKGELISVEYYKNYNYSANTYSDLVVKENRSYVRDNINIVKYREMTIDWYLEDDTVGISKTMPLKYYSPEEAIEEGFVRRRNMIAFAKTVLLRELKTLYGEPTNQSYAFDLLLSLSAQMKYFEEGYTQPLRDAVSNSTKPYLNQNIKDLIITELTF